MRKLFFVILFSTSVLNAQLPFFRPFFSTTERELGKLFFYEVINLISEDTSKSRVDINFRIANDLLTFVKNPLNTPTYIANFTVSAEIFDRNGNSIARKVFRGYRGTDNYEETNSKDIYTQGNFRFDLKPGNYRLTLIIEDEQSNQILKRERNITLKQMKPNSFETSDLTIIQEKIENGDTIILIPTNIGNRVNFGKGFTAYIQFTDKPDEVEYTLIYFPEFGRKKELIKEKIDPEKIKNNRQFLFRENPGDTIFTYLLVPSKPQNYYSLFIPVKGDSLDLGEYEISLSVKFIDTLGKEISKTFSKKFTVEWIDMPFSLQNLDYAIDILEYIATPDEMAKLRFGSPQARLIKFKEFWAKKDPTPNTIYNELMAEYYRRVDYAILNFATMRERDGARTDRGKVYIIYGQPTKIERKYIPGKPTEEIWYYEPIRRKFVFVDQYGSFKLTSVETYEP
ncbi:GWxTD domain-containing protein [Candidatus Chrysopegis kryptomonas]|uniref:GWxTD domain-containing protein n=1 Tax=Candidatus Chryseopegocella kryptomonas TaxID=1633643 RepID=A0A0P1MLQ3_9BACT|nr:GWxTD domain-containing protein [Candidatus Chrysopegis kryptomonas]CUS96296.1 GWxTD domain-containing protein [Candidatus Chrysopegis kryptomonas]